MEGSSQTIHATSKRQVWVRQSTANQMNCVGTNITTFMITAQEDGK